MSQHLTSRQAEELHKSMLAYLVAANLPTSAAALRGELNLDVDEATRKKYEGLLEKKWTSIVRLQKKIMDLETRCVALQHDLDAAPPSSLSRRTADPASWLPRAPPRHVLQGHRLPVTSVAFHPIYTTLASASEDASIKIWDWEHGELERTLKGHTKAVLSVDYGGPRGGTLLASCSADTTVRLWDPADEYKTVRTLPGHDHAVSCVRFIPGGHRGAPLAGHLLASASRDRSIRIWDVTTGFCVRTLRGHTEWVREVSASLDGRWLVSASSDATARLWDLQAAGGEANACRVAFTGHEHVVECAALAPRAAYVHLAGLAGAGGAASAPARPSHAEFVATGSRDKTVRLWDARGTLLLTLHGHDNWVRALAFHPGGKYLVSASDDRTLRCWDLAQAGKCVRVVEGAHGHFVSALRWAPSLWRDVGVGVVGGLGRDGKEEEEEEVTMRCVVATGSVDMSVRVFAG